MIRSLITCFVAITILIVSLPTSASDPSQGLGLGLPENPVAVDGFASLDKVPGGGTIHLAVALTMSGDWHVNANRVNDDFLIPTAVHVDVPEGLTVRSIIYPDGIEKDLGLSENPMLLFEGNTYIGIVVDVAENVEVGRRNVGVTVTYQACDSEKCLAPEDRRLAIPVVVGARTDVMNATNSDVFANIDFAGATVAATVAGGGRLDALIAKRGYMFAFLIVFVWGLALNLTPCVYPMIPITVSYFGGQSSGRMSRAVMLAAVYVLGMAAMYSVLGLFAALTGGLLGSILQNPFMLSFVALVMVGLAFSMFGFYEIQPPARLTALFGQSTSRQGPAGAFLMGLTVGIVAAPCIGPFVIVLLTFVGQSQDPVLGFSLFFVLALGLGAPFLVLATVSGNLSRLPKSGEWMEWVKMLFGFVLIGMAVFFLDPIIHDAVVMALLGALAIASGIFLGFIRKTENRSIFFMSFKRFVGVAGPVLGLYLILAPGHIFGRGAAENGIPWDEFDAARLEEAARNDQYALIDFSAEWCLPCKELDHLTFSDETVVAATANFVALKADLTDSGSEAVSSIRSKYAIRGVPTVVFIDKNGKERKDLRVLGFVDDEEFLARIARLTGGS
ncbi:MAG: thioredoxin family protein [bacterium]|nr:thioredoxin family protein [bacterium]